jgi:hypothetical protein
MVEDSVATVATDVFQIIQYSVGNKIDEITKIFGKMEDPQNRGSFKGQNIWCSGSSAIDD